ncbi:MAG: thioredoxin family protein [Rhodospirillales bacterium]|nr:thioredoxin family protein [Rhodospirillales bacterium]
MLTRRILLGSLAALPFMRPALAAPARPFVIGEFKAAQAADKAILVDITASWCPVCRRQKPILSRLLAEPRFRDMAAFEVDFDAQKDIVGMMNTRMQSTLIVFRGDDEMGRTVGDTNPTSIEALLAMAL